MSRQETAEQTGEWATAEQWRDILESMGEWARKMSMQETAEQSAIYAQRIMDLEEEVRLLRARVRQLEKGHDYWRTMARRLNRNPKPGTL